MEPSLDQIEVIYRACMDPDLWADVLAILSRATNSRGSALAVFNNERYLGWRSSQALEPALSKQIRKYFSLRENKIIDKLKRLNAPEFVTSSNFMTEEEWRSTAFFKDYLDPNALYHASGSLFELPGKDSAIIFTVRDRERGEFEEEELVALNLLRPHLARGLMLAANWGVRRIASTVEAIEKFRLPACAINSEGEIEESNPLFDSIMHHYFIQIGNKLEIRSTRKDKKQNLLSHIKSQNSACSIPIRSIENNPAVIHVAPISSNKTDLYDLKNPYRRYFENNSFIIVLSPIVAGAESSSDLIKSLFDLTKTEAKIAAKLSAGLSIDDISSELKTTKDTVRTHIKNIYSKTCVHSQGQLVALISGVQAL